MNLNYLQYFVTLAHLEHYTKAAEKLSITQPSLSHAIAQLEEELGICLFEKQGRNVRLTRYGRMFLDYTEQALNTLDTGIRKTRAMSEVSGGVIDLGYIYTLGEEYIPRLVRSFLEEHPQYDITFHFTAGNTVDILKGLKEEKYDLVFCSMRKSERYVDFFPVLQQKLVVAVPMGHELSYKDTVTLKETLPYPQVYFNSSSGLRPTIDELFARIHGRPQIAYEIEEDTAMAGLVAENFGIAVMPEIPMLKYIKVKTLEITDPPYERYIYMARRKERYVIPSVEAFAAYVMERTAQNRENSGI